MSDTTKSVDDELRDQICDAVFPPSEAIGRLEYRGGTGIHQTGSFMVTGNFEPAIDRLVQLFAKQLEEAEIRGAEGLYKYAKSHHFGGPLEPTPGVWFERMKTQYVATLPKGGTK